MQMATVFAPKLFLVLQIQNHLPLSHCRHRHPMLRLNIKVELDLRFEIFVTEELMKHKTYLAF